jgi:peptidyl-tRNA hydrolase
LRGGHNKKSIEEHIANGTYRRDRHGVKKDNESQILQEMKDSLWILFDKTKNDLEKTDVEEKSEKYKLLHSLMMEQIKVFNSLVKNPAGQSEQQKEKKDDKIDLATL